VVIKQHKNVTNIRGKQLSKTFRKIGTDSPHGIYVYKAKEQVWELIRVDGEAFKPWEKGVYVIYFDNTKCPACRRYDDIWFPFVEKWINERKDSTKFVIILCDWFARECKSQAASESFKKFEIHASPTTIVLYADDSGEIKYQEKYEGVLYEFELKLILEGFEERAVKAMKGEKVSPPIAKESSSKALEDLIMQIIRSILAGEKKT